MPASIKELADPFINLANGMVSKGAGGPDEVGAGFMYGAARFAAFVTQLVEEEGGEMPRAEQVEFLVKQFKSDLLKHLRQDPLGASKAARAPGLDEGRVVSVDEDPIANAYDHLALGLQCADVALVSFLRGRGQHGLAERLTYRLSEHRDPDGDLAYARRIHEVVCSGELDVSLALFVLSSLLTPRMMGEIGGSKGYLQDPALNEDSRRRFSEFYSRHGLHKFSTMVRKEPSRMSDLELEGGRQVLGEKYAAMQSEFLKERAKQGH